MTRSVSATIISNTLFNAAGRFWGLLVMLFLTPYVLGHIGLERYGVWAVLGVIAGYFGLLDFGMGTSFVKFISGCYGEKNYAGINKVVNTGAAFYAVFGALVLITVFPFLDAALGLLKVPPALAGEVRFVLRLWLAVFAAANLLSAFQAVQGGLQRMDVTSKLSVAATVPTVLGTVAFLEAGYGLRGLMLNSACVLVLTGAANFYLAFKLFPELRLGPGYVDWAMFKKMFSFGFRLQSARLADAVTFGADRLLLAHFLGVGAAGAYQLGSSAAGHLRGLPLLLISAVLPAASELDARLEAEKLRSLYLRGTKYLALAAFPLFFFAAAAAQPLLQAWLGHGYGRSAVVLQVLALGYLANLLTGSGTAVAAAIGKPGYQMESAFLSAAVALVLCPALILYAGFYGAAAATAVALAVGPAWFFPRLHRRLGLSSAGVLTETLLRPFLAALLPALLVFAVNNGLAWIFAGYGRGPALALLLAEGLGFLAIYLPLLGWSRCLDPYDRELFSRAARFLPRGRRGRAAHA